jgi:hypothetical protein
VNEKRHGEIALLALLIVAITAIHLIWLVQDHGPLPIPDGYIYLTKLLRVIDAPPSSLSRVWSSLDALSPGGRPPLYQLLTIPSILLFGRSVAAACTVNLIFIPILLVYTYRFARSICGARAGLLAAFLVGTYPPIVHLTRNYMPYSILPACGILSLWLLAELSRHRSAKSAWLFGASLAFGLMVHPQFLRFAAPTTIIFGLYIWLFPKKTEPSLRRSGIVSQIKARCTDPLFLKGLLPAAFIVILSVLPWYLTAGYRLLAVTRSLNSGSMEEYRGKAVLTIGFESAETAFWFLKTAPGTISWILAIFVVVGVLFGILKRRPSTWILVVSLVSTYLIFDRLTTRAWWGLAVVLPVGAILTSLWVAEIRPRWLSLSLTVLCVAVGSFNFSMVTWGLNPSLEPVAAFLGAPLKTGTCRRRAALPLCPAPVRPAPEHLPEFEAVRRIAGDPKCQKKACRLLKVGGSMSWLQLRYFIAAYYPGRALYVAGPRSPNFGKPYGTEDLLRCDFLLYPTGKRAGKNIYASATLEFLRAPPQAFADAHRKLGIYKGTAKQQSLILIRRVAPLSALEAEVSIAALNLDEKYMGQRFVTLSALYQAGADVQAMRRLYEEALALPVSPAMERRLRLTLKKTRERSRKLHKNPTTER